MWCEQLTSSYMNWSVRADLPTPPLPTIITLWRAREFCPFGFAAAMAPRTKRCKYQKGESSSQWERLWNGRTAKISSKDCRCNKGLNYSACGEQKKRNVASYFPVPSGSISVFRLHSHHGNTLQTNKRLKKENYPLDYKRTILCSSTRTQSWHKIDALEMQIYFPL